MRRASRKPPWHADLHNAYGCRCSEAAARRGRATERVKWDGWHALIIKTGAQFQTLSCIHKDFTRMCPGVAAAALRLGAEQRRYSLIQMPGPKKGIVRTHLRKRES